MASSVSAVEAFARSCAAQGYHPTCVQAAATTSNVLLGTPGINGTIDEDPNLPASDTSSAAIQAMFGAPDQYSPGTVTAGAYSPAATITWAAGMLFAAAAQAGHLANNPTSAQLLAGLYALHNETLGGLAPPLRYQRGKGTTISCWYFDEIQSNHYTAPFGGQTSCSTSA